MARIEYFFVGIPNQGAEFILPEIGPDIFHWVEFGRVGWKGQQGYVVGDDQHLAALMPACAVADQYGVGARRDLEADFLQMRVHRLCVGVGHDHGRADAALWADGAENVGGDVPVVAHHQGAGADWRPDVGVTAFLTDAGFVLEPDFHWAEGRGPEEGGFDQADEVFLKVASASGSFLG